MPWSSSKFGKFIKYVVSGTQVTREHLENIFSSENFPITNKRNADIMDLNDLEKFDYVPQHSGVNYVLTKDPMFNFYSDLSFNYSNSKYGILRVKSSIVEKLIFIFKIEKILRYNLGQFCQV